MHRDQQFDRRPLAEGRDHLTVDGTFQSDRYPTVPAGKVPLSVKDPLAQDLLCDLQEALINAGYRPARKLISTTIPGLKVSHQIITPVCRENRSTTAALIEASQRIYDAYVRYVGVPENAAVSWHLVLTREDGDA